MEAIPAQAQRENAEQQFADTLSRTVAFIKRIPDPAMREAVLDAYARYGQANQRILAYLKDPANYATQDGQLKPLPLPPELKAASSVPSLAPPPELAQVVEPPKPSAANPDTTPKAETPGALDKPTAPEAQGLADHLKEGGTVKVAGVEVSAGKLDSAAAKLAEKAATGQLDGSLTGLLGKLFEWLGKVFGIDLSFALPGAATAAEPGQTSIARVTPRELSPDMRAKQHDALEKIEAVEGWGDIERKVFNKPLPPEHLLDGKIDEGQKLHFEYEGKRYVTDTSDFARGGGISMLARAPFPFKEGVLIRASGRKILIMGTVMIDMTHASHNIDVQICPPVFDAAAAQKLQARLAQKRDKPDDSRCNYFNYTQQTQA